MPQKETAALAALNPSKVALSIRNVGKCYRMYRKPDDRLKQMLFGRWKCYYKDFWALHDVSFDVQAGSTVGVIGTNGSGKSTLLQIIAGIVSPTTGECERRGRVGALIELGSGFNPEFTGRENVRIQCAIMGVEPERITELIPKVLEFSELGDFFDRPVKIYSSGMFVRLAFACQTLIEPEILLVDEVLAVGDSYFQLKCFDAIKKMKDSGMTILLVTHDASSVKKLCDQVVWLRDGAIHRRGSDVNGIVDDYSDYNKKRLKVELSEVQAAKPIAKGEGAENEKEFGRIRSVEIQNEAGEKCSVFPFGAGMRIRIIYELFLEVQGCVLGVAFFDATKFAISALNTKLDDVAIPTSPGVHSCELNVEKLPLLGATYHIDAGIFENQSMGKLDYISNAAEFKIRSNYVGEGLFIIEHNWNVIGK